MKTGIIGSGPAGIFSALAIKEINPNMEVYLFDGNQKIGRKLFATGNGRCNITNMNAGPDSYFSYKPASLQPVFERISPQLIRGKLLDYGIPTVQTEDGWVYPASYSAANVVQILTDQLSWQKVKVFSGTKVTAIKTTEDEKFQLEVKASETKAEDKAIQPDVSNEIKHLTFDRLILTSGSRAFPQLGANTTILSELFQFGHRDLPFNPALAPVGAKGNIFKELQGVRLDAEVTLLSEKQELGSAFGNVIFMDYGLNGPGIMNISHLINAKSEEKYALKINFIPGEIRQQMDELFYSRIKQKFAYRSIFLAFLPEKVVAYFFKISKVSWDATCDQIDSRTFRVHIKRLENCLLPIEGSRGFNFGQTAAGGIPLTEVNLRTMESRKKQNLYFAGEVLDVVGPCGGYNLTWAIATGMIAGNAAGKEEN